ncbi:MAG: BatA domain-containing protein [Thermoguttaceae bacterium]
MTFAVPALLAGTVLIALPIVLHLIMRRKPKLMEFPALRFIRKQHDTNQRRLRLRHLLLLLLRMAAIALLAFALAQPSLKFSDMGMVGSQEAPVAAALVFDAAARMQYRHENRTRLEAAAELGKWLLAQLPSQSEIAVLDTRLGPGAFQVDRGAARQRIERLETVANSQPLTGVIGEAIRLVAQSGLSRKEVYVFTDLSRGGWPADTASALQDRLADVPGVGIYVIDVGIENPTNYGLGGLRLSNQVLSTTGSLRIETDLQRTGPDGERAVELYLLDDQRKEQKRSETSRSLGSDESQTIDFRIGGLAVGTHQGFVRLVGQDGLAEDDTRYFTVEVRPAWEILVAAPDPAERNSLYLTEALAPAVFRQRGQARFVCRVIDLDELEEHALDDYAAVCLLDPTPLDATVWKKLGDFAADGHGVAIFLGRNATAVDSFNRPMAQAVLPGQLLRQALTPYGDVGLAPRDYQHPVLSAFREVAGSVPWDRSPVFRYWQLGDPPPGVAPIVRYTDGSPALLERAVGNGRVLTMTTPVSDDPNRKPWNLLPVGEEPWPFLILVNEMMSYLVGSSDQQLNYFAGQTAVLHLDAQRESPSYLLTTPSDLKFRITADTRRHTLAVTSTDQVGSYRVRAGGTAAGVDRGFSVNLAPEQTTLERITNEELIELFGPFEVRIARTPQEIQRDISSSRVGRELFGTLILLVALALAAEHVVASRFYGK